MSVFEPIKKARLFLARNGTNIACGLWVAGSAFQIAAGVVTGSPRRIVGGALSLLSSVCGMLYGTSLDPKKQGLKGSCLIAPFIHVFNLQDGLFRGDSSAVIAVASNTGCNMLGFFAEPLERKFGNAKNILVRKTLGDPLALMGIGIFAVSYSSGLFNAIAHKNLPEIAFYGLGSVSAGLWSLSKTKGSHNAAPSP